MTDIQNADQYQSGQHHAYGGRNEAIDKNEDKNIRGKTVDQAARELINNKRRQEQGEGVDGIGVSVAAVEQ